MIQTVIIPETVVPMTTKEYRINTITFDIQDKTNVIAEVQVIQLPTVTEEEKHIRYTIAVNALLKTEVTQGNLTLIDVTGLKKCIKAICAKALNLNFTETNEAL